MDNPVLLRTALDGRRTVSFMAAVLAAATTQRPGAARWTELTVYRLAAKRADEPPRGGYVVAKVGRSVVAHRASCKRAQDKRKLTPTSNRGDRGRVGGWSPCLDCQPGDTGAVWMEEDRHTLLQARTPSELAKILMRGRPGQEPATTLTGIVAETVQQIRRADADFDHWWPDHLYPEAEHR
jgi:hypothetical protein